MAAVDIIGAIGALLVLIPFWMNQTNRWRNDNFYFDVCNFTGSALLMISAIMLHSVPFIVVNLIWAIVSLKDLIGRGRKR